jgi:guanosine-3',5'-bis(diphosphate) 3'-pyrophosphohydrolase
MSSTPGIDAAIERSGLVREAFETARTAHAGQFRDEAERIPYIDHPRIVADRLARQGFPDEVLAAALLHDVVEDSETEVEELRTRFGDRVADLVAAMTEDEAIEDYERRKAEHRQRIAEAGDEALAIYAADKLTNLAMLRDGYRERGEAVGGQLSVSLDLKVAVWEADLATLLEQAPDLPLVREFADEMVGLWGDRASGARASG